MAQGGTAQDIGNQGGAPAAAGVAAFDGPLQVRGDYSSDGVVALHKAGDPARLALLRERAEAMFDLFDELTQPQLAALDGGDYRFHGALPYRRIDRGFRILDALHPALMPLLRRLLGSDQVALRNCIVRRMQPQRVETRASFHQDLQFLWPHDGPMATVWIPLEACDGTRPGLQVLPRRLTALVGPSRTERQKRDPAFRDYVEGAAGMPYDAGIALQEAEIAALAPDGALWEPRLAVGDMLLFDGMTVHRSALHPAMSASRISVELRCAPPLPADRQAEAEGGA
ncbi:MAG: phytanoyl-CoA dioxygenase family protein [Sneathiellaceae bacterium]